MQGLALQHSAPAASSVSTPFGAMIEHLSAAIQCRTIAVDDPSELNGLQFLHLRKLLVDAYPRLHQTLVSETVNRLSLLYEWLGTDPSLAPILLLAHQDVVPAENEHAWLHPPFAGHVSDQAVWGRGAIDAKGGLIAICEAVEQLITNGFKPRRSIFLAFGHDEEVGGLHGAASMGKALAARGISPMFISDEGGAILHGVVPGVRKPVAAVGIAEKGYLTLELKVTASGGHASMPPAQTAIGILSDAIQRIEASPFPARLTGATRQMVKCLGSQMPLPARAVISMLPVTSGIIRRKLEKTLSGAASLRTTTAVTMIESGVKDNILPHQATATLNCRIIPGESSKSVLARIKDVIDDRRVRLAVAGRFHSEPPPIADVKSRGYLLIKQTIAEIAPDAIIAPCLVLGGTDSRHYTHLTSSIYRFGAMHITPEDLATIHGANEKLTFENCELLERFYVRLLSNAASN
jgi:carboxypeptidase PM20D1